MFYIGIFPKNEATVKGERRILYSDTHSIWQSAWRIAFHFSWSNI